MCIIAQNVKGFITENYTISTPDIRIINRNENISVKAL